MNAQDITGILWLYTILAIVGSIFTASALEKRLKSRTPATRPYRWGFYVGTMGIACAPIALLTILGAIVAGRNRNWIPFGECLAFAVFFIVHTVCGWFIIRRKRWAWVLGTIFSCNIFVWIINYNYGRNRWGEFVGEPYGSAGTEDEGYELLADATKLETQGQVQEAIAAYQRVVDNYSHTPAGKDAQKSVEALRAKIQ
jgi:hypothetical protein